MKIFPVRAAAGIALLQGLAHGGMFLSARPVHGPGEIAVIAAMRGHVFDFAGSLRSYWDMYTGYGLLAAGTCLIEAVLLWLVAPVLLTDMRAARSILALILAANFIHALMISRYFFWIPLAPDILVMLLLTWAIWETTKPQVSAL